MFANILDVVQGKLGPVSGEVLQWQEESGHAHYTVWETVETQRLLVNLLTGSYESKDPGWPFSTAYVEVRGTVGPGHELSVDLDTKNWYTPGEVIRLDYPVAVIPGNANITDAWWERLCAARFYRDEDTKEYRVSLPVESNSGFDVIIAPKPVTGSRWFRSPGVYGDQDVEKIVGNPQQIIRRLQKTTAEELEKLKGQVDSAHCNSDMWEAIDRVRHALTSIIKAEDHLENGKKP